MADELTKKAKPGILPGALTHLNAGVILFNDEWHTFDEVIRQIVIATDYSRTKAEIHTWEVHTKGKSIIYSGDLGKCLYISSVLEDINLGTAIQF